jgi:hypothetical protein
VEETKKPVRLAEGWGWPANSRKAHYVRKQEAICGGWWFSGELFSGNEDSSDNCAKCKRLRAKEPSK